MSNISHPDHYMGTSLECIDAMVITFGYRSTFDFCSGCVFKYLWRYKLKNGDEDLQKAQIYYNMAASISKLAEDDGEDLTEFNLFALQNMGNLLSRLLEK